MDTQLQDTIREKEVSGIAFFSSGSSHRFSSYCKDNWPPLIQSSKNMKIPFFKWSERRRIPPGNLKLSRVNSSPRQQNARILRKMQLEGSPRLLVYDIGDRDWQIKQLKANQNKTIVEHVHVLQEAKRVTDGQLEDALRELAAEQARTKALEKTKARLMGEAEDMVRQHEQELIALRSNEKNARSLEQKTSKAVADMEREKSLREVTESQSRRFQTELIEAQAQLSDLERQLQSTQRAKESLEAEISSLAADGDTARALKKLRRDYETKISQLELQVEEADTARATMEKIRQKIEQQHIEIRRLITTSGARDSFRERLLKELQTLDDSLAAEFSKKAPKSSKRNSVQSLANLSHVKRSSISIETNGLGRSRKDSQPPDSPHTPHILHTPDRNTTQLKQQVQALELRIIASDRVRQHLEATLKEMIADIEKIDGSKASLQAHRSKITRENARLVDLLDQEAEARRAAEAAHMEGISEMWKKFQVTIEGEKETYNRLEESRKALIVKQKATQVELEEHKRNLKEMTQGRKQLLAEVAELKERLENENHAKNTEIIARRRLQEQLQELQISTAASTSMHGGKFIFIVNLNEAVESYKAKMEDYMAKLEAAEIERAKLHHQESLTRRSLNEAERLREEAASARQAAEKRLKDAEQRINELESKLNDESRDFADMELFTRRAKEEMEDERDQNQKELAERDFKIEQTRQMYQSELRQLNEESRHLRDTISSLREENHKMRSEFDGLQLRYDDEVYAGSSWKKEKERMNTKILDLIAAYESSKMAQADSQTEIVRLHSQILELRAARDEAETERAALMKAREQLETRLNDIAQDHLDTNKMSNDRVLQDLHLEKRDLKARLEEQADRVAKANEKLKRAESFANEYQVELSKVRHDNSELEKQNAALEKANKELNIRMVEYEAKTYAITPQPTGSRRQEARIEELTNRLLQEEKEKSETAQLHRTADKTAREMKFQLMESDRQRLRLEEEVQSYEGKLQGLRQEFNDLLKNESDLKVTKRRAELEAQDFRQKYLKYGSILLPPEQ
ncbi:hypothetical protein CPB86DRAFT_715748 [Serendipita vermifera]|nr:hypothetical protein CPB86DRAFT_715748 [Serendipita vermifera]